MCHPAQNLRHRCGTHRTVDKHGKTGLESIEVKCTAAHFCKIVAFLRIWPACENSLTSEYQKNQALTVRLVRAGVDVTLAPYVLIQTFRPPMFACVALVPPPLKTHVPTSPFCHKSHSISQCQVYPEELIFREWCTKASMVRNTPIDTTNTMDEEL